MDVEGQHEQEQQQQHSDSSPIRRTILLILFLIVIPCLWYYYLARYVVPVNPWMQLNDITVERSAVSEETEVSKWSMNLTVHNPDKRWQGNFRDVRFKLLMKDEAHERGRVLSTKTVEPFTLGCVQGLQIILNMDVLDDLEEEDWEEEKFAIRMYLKASYEDSSFVGDYWEVRRECANLRFRVKKGTAELKNDVPAWCRDRVRIVPHRHFFST